jgi:hypothetical protein
MSRLVNNSIVSDSGSANSGVVGIYIEAHAYVRYFTLGAYNSATNSQTIRIAADYLHVWGPTTTGRSSSSFAKFWINVASPTGTNTGLNVETRTSGNPTYNESPADVYTYTFPGRITTVAAFVSVATFASGNNLTVVRNVYTGNMTIYNSSADFNFIDASPNLSKIIRLPPITSAVTGKLYFYKITGTLTRNAYILTDDGSLIKDHNIAGVVITNNHGCLTLVSNGTEWYIANYYPSSLQNSLPTTSTDVSNANKIANSTINNINIFNTDANANRRDGAANMVRLPALNGTPGICIVVYCGTIDGRTGGNVLLFTSTEAAAGTERKIDGPSSSYNNTSQKPYIVANETHKNTGIVFITNGTYWYIAGWFNGSNWQTSANPANSGGVTNVQLSPLLNNYSYFITTTNGGNRYYILPQDNPSLNPPALLIVKARSDATSMEFNSIQAGSGANVVINKDTKNMYFNTTKTNICVWFVRELLSGVIRYYPIISYTPFS